MSIVRIRHFRSFIITMFFLYFFLSIYVSALSPSFIHSFFFSFFFSFSLYQNRVKLSENTNDERHCVNRRHRKRRRGVFKINQCSSSSWQRQSNLTRCWLASNFSSCPFFWSAVHYHQSPMPILSLRRHPPPPLRHPCTTVTTINIDTG